MVTFFFGDCDRMSDNNDLVCFHHFRMEHGNSRWDVLLRVENEIVPSFVQANRVHAAFHTTHRSTELAIAPPSRGNFFVFHDGSDNLDRSPPLNRIEWFPRPSVGVLTCVAGLACDLGVQDGFQRGTRERGNPFPVVISRNSARRSGKFATTLSCLGQQSVSD